MTSCTAVYCHHQSKLTISLPCPLLPITSPCNLNHSTNATCMIQTCLMVKQFIFLTCLDISMFSVNLACRLLFLNLELWCWKDKYSRSLRCCKVRCDYRLTIWFIKLLFNNLMLLLMYGLQL